jgi:hypothetical protein
MYLQKVIRKKTLKNKLFVVDILSATGENAVSGFESGSVSQWYRSGPKCHGSSTLFGNLDTDNLEGSFSDN